MRYKSIKKVTVTLTRTLYPVADFVSPFTRGRECVLVLAKYGGFAGGDVTIETDNASDGSFSDVRAAADADAATTQVNEYFNITLGDNIAITAAAVTAGGFEVLLLGDT
jgi:hypothetical protein